MTHRLSSSFEPASSDGLPINAGPAFASAANQPKFGECSAHGSLAGAKDRIELFSAHDLKLKIIEPVDFVVSGLVPLGLTILAGLPKVGKSWLALDIAVSVADGEGCLGQDPQPKGDVLYLALEDGMHRLKKRLMDLIGEQPAWPKNLVFATDWPRADNGGVEALQNWLRRTPSARLVIIDVFQRHRSTGTRHGSGFERDYADLERLQKLALKNKIGIVLVHHLRKASSRSDPFEQIAGTTGLTAAADTILMLDQNASGTRLYGRGKDIETIDAGIVFDKNTKCWQLADTPVDAGECPERDAIRDLLRQRLVPMSPKDMAKELGRSSTAIRTMLSRMHACHELVKQGRGRYALPSR